MIRHILTLIWNQRRSNVWIFLELLLVAAILTLVGGCDIVGRDRCVGRGFIYVPSSAGAGYAEYAVRPAYPAESFGAGYSRYLSVGVYRLAVCVGIWRHVRTAGADDLLGYFHPGQTNSADEPS